MSKICNQWGTIRKSRNLRGLVDYARKSPVTWVQGTRHPTIPERGSLLVFYADGSWGTDEFASYRIMVDWIRNRLKHCRGWIGCPRVDLTENMGYITKPGTIAGAV
jgi:hypothetical protein